MAGEVEAKETATAPVGATTAEEATVEQTPEGRVILDFVGVVRDVMEHMERSRNPSDPKALARREEYLLRRMGEVMRRADVWWKAEEALVRSVLGSHGQTGTT